MSDFIIELNKLSCKSGKKYLLKDINWQIKPGEHWVVFGMNGSGKTTLLSIIAGFRNFTKGDFKIFNEEISNENILNVRRRIGWVSSSFFDKYYTKESALNIVLSGKSGTLGINGSITLNDVRLAKKLLIEFGLGDKIDYPFSLMSKGERQNVLIARALFPNPDILILDEPCTGLDIYNRSYLFNIIEKISATREMTIIYVTHYVEEIIPLFKKTLLLKNGHTLAQGDTEKMFTDEMMEKLLGYPVKILRNDDQTYRVKINAESSLEKLLCEVRGSDR